MSRGQGNWSVRCRSPCGIEVMNASPRRHMDDSVITVTYSICLHDLRCPDFVISRISITDPGEPDFTKRPIVIFFAMGSNLDIS